MTFTFNNIEFSIEETNGTFLVFRQISEGNWKKYKTKFTSFGDAYNYCKRMGSMSQYMKDLYKAVKDLCTHFSCSIESWMWKKAKETVKTAKEIFQFNKGLVYAR